MTYAYIPRRAPKRFFEGAPEVVRKEVLDFLEIKPAAPLDYDVVLRGEVDRDQFAGVDFDRHGAQGCHFFLNGHELRSYRRRNSRKRVAWKDLPEATQKAIVTYLEMEA